jgi:hypothetical protein
VDGTSFFIAGTKPHSDLTEHFRYFLTNLIKINSLQPDIPPQKKKNISNYGIAVPTFAYWSTTILNPINVQCARRLPEGMNESLKTLRCV